MPAVRRELTRRQAVLTRISSRGLSGLCLTLLLIAAVIAVQPSPQDRSDGFWGAMLVQGIQRENYQSLADMQDAAEATILGRITGVQAGRVITDPNEPRDSVLYLTAEVAIERVLSGSIQPGHEGRLQLEVMLPDEALLDRLVAEFPTERAIMFVRNKGSEVAELGFPADVQAMERDYYRLVRTEAIMREFNGLIRVAVDTTSPFLQALDGRSFQELINTLQAAE